MRLWKPEEMAEWQKAIKRKEAGDESSRKRMAVARGNLAGNEEVAVALVVESDKADVATAAPSVEKRIRSGRAVVKAARGKVGIRIPHQSLQTKLEKEIKKTKRKNGGLEKSLLLNKIKIAIDEAETEVLKKDSHISNKINNCLKEIKSDPFGKVSEYLQKGDDYNAKQAALHFFMTIFEMSGEDIKKDTQVTAILNNKEDFKLLIEAALKAEKKLKQGLKPRDRSRRYRDRSRRYRDRSNGKEGVGAPVVESNRNGFATAVIAANADPSTEFETFVGEGGGAIGVGNLDIALEESSIEWKSILQGLTVNNRGIIQGLPDTKKPTDLHSFLSSKLSINHRCSWYICPMGDKAKIIINEYEKFPTVEKALKDLKRRCPIDGSFIQFSAEDTLVGEADGGGAKEGIAADGGSSGIEQGVKRRDTGNGEEGIGAPTTKVKNPVSTAVAAASAKPHL